MKRKVARVFWKRIFICLCAVAVGLILFGAALNVLPKWQEARAWSEFVGTSYADKAVPPGDFHVPGHLVVRSLRAMRLNDDVVIFMKLLSHHNRWEQRFRLKPCRWLSCFGCKPYPGYMFATVNGRHFRSRRGPCASEIVLDLPDKPLAEIREQDVVDSLRQYGFIEK